LSLVKRRVPSSVFVFLTALAIFDDLGAIVVIALFYGGTIEPQMLLIALALAGVLLLLGRLRVQAIVPYAGVGVLLWIAVLASGIHPTVAGVVIGLALPTTPRRTARDVVDDLDEATTALRRQCDERGAAPEGTIAAIERHLESVQSPLDRAMHGLHGAVAFGIVPLFALANAGIPVQGDFLTRAYRSPITFGIIAAYVLGKPVGILVGSWLVRWVSAGALRPPVGWAAVAGGGTISGIGFTVSLLIATLAFSGADLQEAKLGILTAALGAAGLTWVLFRITAALPPGRRARALLGSAESIVDLADPVHPDRDHVRGPCDADLTLVEYADFECPYCGQAEPIIRELLADFGDIRYVWRHLPLRDVHPHAQIAAEAAEVAARQGAFWAMHDLLLDHQVSLLTTDLVGYAEQLGLDVARFTSDLRAHAGAARVAQDVASADLSGVSGTPTFFLNGRRHHGAYDIGSLSDAVRLARAQASL